MVKVASSVFVVVNVKHVVCASFCVGITQHLFRCSFQDANVAVTVLGFVIHHLLFSSHYEFCAVKKIIIIRNTILCV